MSETLQEIIKLTLSEISRYERETGKRYSFEEEIKKYVSKSHPTRYAFTMTQVPKVGINPQTQYDTPAGVYAYPLNQAFYKKLIRGELPFANNMPYCNIMRLNFDAGKWLITSSKGLDRSSDADVEDVLKKVRDKGWGSAASLWIHGKHVNFGNDSKIFDITYFATRNEKRSTAAWTKLLRELGYIGIYDPGNSVIHPNEPSQLVCLDPKAYTWVETYETRAIRKPAYSAELHGDLASGFNFEDLSPEKVKKWAEEWNPQNFSWTNATRAEEILSGSIKVDDATLKTVIKKMPNSEAAIRHVLQNKNAPQEVLNDVMQKLFSIEAPSEFNIKNIVMLLLHPKCPPEAWHKFVANIERFPSSALKVMHVSSNVSSDTLRQVFNTLTDSIDVTQPDTKYNFLMQALADLLVHPKMPKDILDEIATGRSKWSKFPTLKKAVMYNPNTTNNERDVLVTTLTSAEVNLIDKIKLAKVVTLTQLEAIQVLRVIRQQKPKNRAMYNILEDLILRKTPFSPDTFDTLITKYSEKEKLSELMKNSHMPIKTLRKLYQSHDKTVSLAARAALLNKKRLPTYDEHFTM